jgi:leucyl/phenylalanyl-tRNA---protein transferase
MPAVFCFSSRQLAEHFPEPRQALTEPDGLLAAGGDLSTARLIEAYQNGIFPWYEEGQPILWWSPDPRTVLYPEQLNISRSLKKTLRRGHFSVSFDRQFRGVIQACAQPRGLQRGTWLTRTMIEAYLRLHNAGYAHSIECWEGTELVGGLYGVAIGQVFFGESMFSRQNDASKVCLVYLTERLRHWGYRLIDCQVHSDHLESLGAIRIARDDFLNQLASWSILRPHPLAWQRRT